ncbi:hypothetical protein A5844_001549 [Enterococcus sp. 10A9_DIV0425]|uniref:Uncharacterized protein n=1 Tax=Candidatus Enterococcus wittei TaxID=1987383 RepID=A0A242K2B4_9ENTE|nr:hypothetical protein [Enterococcus sp. 10A9_DIV0425]OTP11414.1 hypothetical protein A5844_001549 [Enterococcus sp. 10A9_DIV0425]THE07661.1 hypothetical protein E1H99_12295 [Enterococcus hirae]
MEILIFIAQTFLDGLKWLMEGSNWLFLLPILFICLYIMVSMAKKKETLLIFIWYLAAISIGCLLIVLLWGGLEALLFASIFILLYLVVYLPYGLNKLHVTKKGRHAASYRSRKQIRSEK